MSVVGGVRFPIFSVNVVSLTSEDETLAGFHAGTGLVVINCGVLKPTAESLQTQASVR